MSSFLQKAPNDVLQHIAFSSATSTIFQPPTATIHLSQTCRSVYDAICLKRCPQLYSRIFSVCFDVSAPLRRLGAARLTASCLSGVLVQRCQALRRIRRQIFSIENLRQDLWTIYGMLLESDGLNEYQLLMAGLPDFIIAFLRQCLRDEHADHEVKSLAVRLCSMTISRRKCSQWLGDIIVIIYS